MLNFASLTEEVPVLYLDRLRVISLQFLLIVICMVGNEVSLAQSRCCRLGLIQV